MDLLNNCPVKDNICGSLPRIMTCTKYFDILELNASSRVLYNSFRYKSDNIPNSLQHRRLALLATYTTGIKKIELACKN